MVRSEAGESLIVVADDASFTTASSGSSQITLVYFWAQWCGPCRALGPILEKLAQLHADVLRVVKVNSDESPRLAAEFRVLAVPTMKVIQDGRVVRTIVGAKPLAALEFELAPFLAPEPSVSAPTSVPGPASVPA